MKDIDKVLSIAAAEIGTTESPANSNMQKYGKAYGTNGVAWCVQFQWWCFKQAGLSDLFYGGDKTASCSRLKKYAESVGQWVTSNYKRGDLVIFDFPTGKYLTDHIGIVESVNDTTLTTIEGNTAPDDKGSQYNGGGVWRKYRNMKDTVVVGAFRPKYDEGEEEMTQEQFNKMMDAYLDDLAKSPPSDWSNEARTWAEDNSYVKGDSSGNKQYKKFVTKEEVTQMLFNILGEK